MRWALQVIRRPRWAAAIAVVTGLVGFGVLLGFGVFGGTAGTGVQDDSAGRMAPAFTLPGFDGSAVGLSDYVGKPVFLYFWASWCVPCREEAPLLESMWREYRERGVIFLGVNIQDNETDARAFLREFNITFPNVRDGEGRVYIDYGVYGVPESFFIRRGGLILRHWIGPFTEDQLRERLDELLASPG